VTIRVLIADDQPMVRAGLAMLLDAEPGIEVVGEAGDGAAAVVDAKRLRPDVVLLDVRMPVMDGVEATKMLVGESFPADPDRLVRVLILTTYNVDETVYAALRAGASGFLLKDAAPRDLISAVRAVAGGDAWLDPAVARGLITEFAARPVAWQSRSAELDRLTNREREVLVLIAHGMSNAEIAEWLVLGEATVKTHFSRLLMKLGVRDRAQAIVVAYQSGLVTPGSTPPPRSS
jgi:DNA-binding NarL/FixJ family response regulator